MRFRVLFMMGLASVIGAGVANGAATQDQVAKLVVGPSGEEIAVIASAWGNVTPEKGEHVRGLPSKDTKGLSLATDTKTFPILQRLVARMNDSLTGSGTIFPVALRFYDSAGDDYFTHTFTGISGFSCSDKSRTCRFAFTEVEWKQK